MKGMPRTAQLRHYAANVEPLLAAERRIEERRTAKAESNGKRSSAQSLRGVAGVEMPAFQLR